MRAVHVDKLAPEPTSTVLTVKTPGGRRTANLFSDGTWECVAVDGYGVPDVKYTRDEGAARRFVEAGERPR
jgi:hypothetical protein